LAHRIGKKKNQDKQPNIDHSMPHLFFPSRKMIGRKNWPAKSIKNRLAGQLIKLVEAAGIEPAS